MSDKPLFQDMDQQEATYAPEQLPPGSAQTRQAQLEDGVPNSDVDQAVPTEEAAVLDAAPGAVTPGPVDEQLRSAGAPPAAAPAIAGEVFAERSAEGTKE